MGNIPEARARLLIWYTTIETDAAHIPEMMALKKTIQVHEDQILNYFEEGHTNAFAESLNSKIQRLILSNYGIRDRNFFHFRLKRYLS